LFQFYFVKYIILCG